MLLALSLSASVHYMGEQERLAAAGDLGGALGSVRLAERLDPFSPEPPQARALLLQRQGREEQAAEALREATERDPHNYVPYLLLGNLRLSALNDLDAATESYRKALELNPNMTIARLALGETLVRAGKLEEAREQYEKLRASGYITPQGLYNLGRIYVRTGEPAEGVKAIKAARHQIGAGLEGTKGSGREQTQTLLTSMDLALADGFVVQRKYERARAIVAKSEARQAPAILVLLSTNPEGYRKSVKSSAIY